MRRSPLIMSAAALGFLMALPLAASAQTNDPSQQPQGRAMMGAGAMPMMGGGGMMGQGMAQRMMFDHVEGRVALLKAELKITDAETPAWNGFADAVRAQAKTLGDLQQAMTKTASAPATFAARLDSQERWLAARLEGLRTLKTAYTALSAKLSDEQKRTAEELLSPRFGMGMMAMGRAAQPAN